ncbi:LacI family DNA-binding transcriptional regulator [Paenibacillus chungangensis]|uniref:LacI family DNA-binding transcriptional regulator n=1 Tax=Paenibacillus chungangensis TaxID=696535 RepID=A0ABW3HV66_9BACL
MVSRKEVAERAGVSVATVSYVLNGKPGVSEQTRQKVHAVMSELGYKPSYAARALKIKKTNHFAVLVHYLGDPFEAGILSHIEHQARRHGYFVSFQTYHPEDEERFLQEVSGRIDGVILLGQSLMPETLNGLRSAGIPVLSIMEPMQQSEWITTVDMDWEAGMTQLIRHLAEQGHRRIGFMATGIPRHPHEQRRQAFRSAMLAEGLPCEEEDVLSGGGRLEEAKSAMKHYLASEAARTCTAWIAANDLMAVGMLSACREAGLKVPGDLSIAGSENILMSEQTEPRITVLDYPRKHIAHIAVDMLVAIIENKQPRGCKMESRLLIRGSSMHE